MQEQILYTTIRVKCVPNIVYLSELSAVQRCPASYLISTISGTIDLACPFTVKML